MINEISYPHIIENPKFWTEEFIDWESQDREKNRVKNELITVYEGKVQGSLIQIAMNWYLEF